MSDKTIKLNLKQKILDSNGKDIKVVDRNTIMISNTGSISIPKDTMTTAKAMTLGYALEEIFSRKLKVESFKDSADMKLWHSKFHNNTVTAKGTIELDSDQLKEIKEIMDNKGDPTKIEVLVDGQVYNIITDALQKALTKK